MNDFDYQIEFAKVNSAKYVHELEALVRKHVLSYYKICTIKSLSTLINQYKIINYSLQQLRTKSSKLLPNFVNDSILVLEQMITKRIVDEPISYEQFIDCFQYCGKLTIECNQQYEQGYQILKAFALIVQDNPQPYSFIWQYSSNPLYRHLMLTRQHITVTKILELEHFKQQHNLVNNTIVEAELAKLYIANQTSCLEDIEKGHQFNLQIDQAFQTIKSKL